MVKSSEILIIDNDQNITNALEKILEDEGYSIATANTGKKAKKILRQENPQVIILDIRLPDIHGTAMISYLKQNNSKTKIIVLSGDTSYTTINTAIAHGADDYLIKPVEFTMLNKAIQTQLKTTTHTNLTTFKE